MFEQIHTMAEGEPTESKSHDWNKESAFDTRKRQQAEQAREQAELIQQHRQKDIDSHITALRQQAQTPLHNLAAAPSGVDRDRQDRANIEHKLRLERQASVYSYMKKTYHARTIGDVEDKLRHREVDPGVIRLWIDERMVDLAGEDPLLERAIAEGYPEFDEDIKQKREQQPWRQADNMNDFLGGLDEVEE